MASQFVYLLCSTLCKQTQALLVKNIPWAKQMLTWRYCRLNMMVHYAVSIKSVLQNIDSTNKKRMRLAIIAKFTLRAILQSKECLTTKAIKVQADGKKYRKWQHFSWNFKLLVMFKSCKSYLASARNKIWCMLVTLGKIGQTSNQISFKICL